MAEASASVMEVCSHQQILLGMKKACDLSVQIVLPQELKALEMWRSIK
jgi:hypothetical protein